MFGDQGFQKCHFVNLPKTNAVPKGVPVIVITFSALNESLSCINKCFFLFIIIKLCRSFVFDKFHFLECLRFCYYFKTFISIFDSYKHDYQMTDCMCHFQIFKRKIILKTLGLMLTLKTYLGVNPKEVRVSR